MSAILDSGNRRTFQTGAVRDIQEGKGRCDLLPLLPIYNMLRDDILFCINQFEDSGDPKYLLEAVLQFSTEFDNSVYTMLLEVSIHFEQGAQKYGENNWTERDSCSLPTSTAPSVITLNTSEGTMTSATIEPLSGTSCAQSGHAK